MIIVKILNLKEPKYNTRPVEYAFTLRDGDNITRGKIYINFILEEIIVDIKRPLSKKECLAIQKEIFYNFCSKINLRKNKYNIGTFKFVDKNNDGEYESMINEIIKSGIYCFDFDSKKETVIINIKDSINDISKLNEDVINERDYYLKLRKKMKKSQVVSYIYYVNRYLENNSFPYFVYYDNQKNKAYCSKNAKKHSSNSEENIK